MKSTEDSVPFFTYFKQDANTAGIPIVVVSADALALQISDALDAGAARYLTKPVSVNQLLGVLDELLGRIDTTFNCTVTPP